MEAQTDVYANYILLIIMQTHLLVYVFRETLNYMCISSKKKKIYTNKSEDCLTQYRALETILWCSQDILFLISYDKFMGNIRGKMFWFIAFPW